MWGIAVKPDLTMNNYKSILLEGRRVTLEEAVFRSEKAFRPANLKEHLDFWENEILKDHPQKKVLLGYLSGVKLEDFFAFLFSGGISRDTYQFLLS